MDNENELLSIIAAGLDKVSRNQTAHELGDRSLYLGLSDLAKGLSCPRSVVMSKLTCDSNPKSLDTLLTLARGHWLEHGLEEALRAHGTKFVRQLEIAVVHDSVPIKAHLDLVLADMANNSIIALEVKSAARPRDFVYESHEAQLYGQLGLLSKFWDKPVFKANGIDIAYAFPELAKNALGLDLPAIPGKDSISGFVLTVSPNNAKAFGPYRPDSSVLSLLMAKASEIWSAILAIKANNFSLDTLGFHSGFSPLCDYCSFNRDCPKFAGVDNCDTDLESELAILADLKAKKTALELEVKDREDSLKKIASRIGQLGQWITAENYRFRVATQAGRTTFDPSVIKSSLASFPGIDPTVIDALMDSAQKVGKPFERLYLSPVN
jgi:hypothetical protein